MDPMRVMLLIALAFVGCAKGGAGLPDVDAPPGGGDECGGLPCEALHVAPTGIDSNNGSPDSPMKTLTAALSRASIPNPPLAVFVQAGTYRETITMKPGVSVYGGFDASWARDVARNATTIEGASPAVKFENITVATKLDGITV